MAKSTDQNLAELLKKAQGGDRAALNTLCKEIEFLLRAYFWDKYKDNDIVDELAQETYIRLYHSFQTIKEPTKFRGWIVKIALHVDRDFHRRRYASKEEPFIPELYDQEGKQYQDNEPEMEPVIMDENIDTNIDLQRALMQMDEKTRRIILMKIDGYKFEEIARETGLTSAAVKMQYKRSIKKLQSLIFFVTFCLFNTTIFIEALG